MTTRYQDPLKKTAELRAEVNRLKVQKTRLQTLETELRKKQASKLKKPKTQKIETNQMRSKPKSLAKPHPRLPSYNPNVGEKYSAESTADSIREIRERAQAQDRARMAKTQRVQDLERQIKNAAKPSARNIREIKAAKAATPLRSSIRANIGQAVSRVAKSGAGRVAGQVLSKVAAPLMVAEGAYSIVKYGQARYGAYKAQEEAKRNESYMQSKYGDVKKATATRHANERRKQRVVKRDNLKQGYLLK